MLNLCQDLIKKDLSALRVLEIGPGKNPILNKKDFSETFFIDKEFQYEGPNKINKNFLDFKSDLKFDLIFERLCWHEQNKNNWNNFLDNVISHLSPNGLFISEHAIGHKEMAFEEDSLHYDEETMQLWDLSRDIILRFIPSSNFIENILIEKKLNIKFFKIPFGKKVIFERNNSQTKSTDPDLLQLIAQKPL